MGRGVEGVGEAGRDLLGVNAAGTCRKPLMTRLNLLDPPVLDVTGVSGLNSGPVSELLYDRKDIVSSWAAGAVGGAGVGARLGVGQLGGLWGAGAAPAPAAAETVVGWSEGCS